MPRARRVCSIAVGLLVLLAFSRAAATADRRPNVIVLVADDLGYGELSCQGNPQIPTPHIDAMAAAGIRKMGSA